MVELAVTRPTDAKNPDSVVPKATPERPSAIIEVLSGPPAHIFFIDAGMTADIRANDRSTSRLTNSPSSCNCLAT